MEMRSIDTGLFVDFIYFLGIGKHLVPDNKIAKTFVLDCASLGDWGNKKD